MDNDAIIIVTKCGNAIQMEASGDGASLVRAASTALLSIVRQVKRDDKTLEDAVAGVIADAFSRLATSENATTIRETEEAQA